MGLFSTEKIFGIKIRESANDGSDFGAADADYRFLYLGEDGALHTKDASSVVRYLPGSEIDYVEFTSAVSVTATSEATATTIVTGNAITYNAAQVITIEAYWPYMDNPVTRDFFIVLYDGASSIGRLGLMNSPDATNFLRPGPFRAVRRLTPSAAAHTYSIRGYMSAGTGTVGAGAGGSGNYMPGFIRITAA